MNRYSFTLKKKVSQSFETSVVIYQSTRHNIPRGNESSKNRCGSFRSLNDVSFVKKRLAWWDKCMTSMAPQQKPRFSFTLCPIEFRIIKYLFGKMLLKKELLCCHCCSALVHNMMLGNSKQTGMDWIDWDKTDSGLHCKCLFGGIKCTCFEEKHRVFICL